MARDQDDPTRRSDKVRWAVVGLGHFAQTAVLPSFDHVGKNVKLAAVVSDDPDKVEMARRRYGVSLSSTYADMDALLHGGDVDAVYVAVPNHLHHEMVLRAAEAGVHVLCEKPMAVDEEECREMIAACDSNDVKLMVGYRLHLERANMAVVEAVRRGKIGEPRIFSSVFAFQLEDGNVRALPAERGGGPLYDIGIYCINAARYVFGQEPIGVVAASGTRADDPRFRNVEEQASAILEFPDGKLATFVVGFGASAISEYTVVGTEGMLRLDPAYDHDTPHVLERRIGGKTSEKTFKLTDQVAAEIAYFSECIRDDVDPEPSGREGLNDVAIIEAIRLAMRTHARVPLSLDAVPRPSGESVVVRAKPGTSKKVVHVHGPAQG